MKHPRFASKIKAAGFRHVVPTDTVQADDGRDLYYLIFATNNQTGLKIFTDIDARTKAQPDPAPRNGCDPSAVPG